MEKGPGPQSYRLLADMRLSVDQVYARVPETLIFGFGFDSPSLVYSNKAGALQCIEGVGQQHLSEFFDFIDQKTEAGSVLPTFIEFTPGQKRLVLSVESGKAHWATALQNRSEIVLQRYLPPLTDRIFTLTLSWRSISPGTVSQSMRCCICKLIPVGANTPRRQMADFLDEFTQQTQGLAQDIMEPIFNTGSSRCNVVITKGNYEHIRISQDVTKGVQAQFLDLVSQFKFRCSDKLKTLLELSGRYTLSNTGEWFLLKITKLQARAWRHKKRIAFRLPKASLMAKQKKSSPDPKPLTRSNKKRISKPKRRQHVSTYDSSLPAPIKLAIPRENPSDKETSPPFAGLRRVRSIESVFREKTSANLYSQLFGASQSNGGTPQQQQQARGRKKVGFSREISPVFKFPTPRFESDGLRNVSSASFSEFPSLTDQASTVSFHSPQQRLKSSLSSSSLYGRIHFQETRQPSYDTAAAYHLSAAAEALDNKARLSKTPANPGSRVFSKPVRRFARRKTKKITSILLV